MTRHRILPLRLLAAAWLAVCLAGCGPGNGAPRAPVRIVPASPADGAPASSPGPVSARSDDAALRPRISIDPSDSVLQIVNTNLDQDAEQEQVIAVKRTGDVDAPVRIIVADADPTQGAYYYQSWEAETNATDSRVFSLAVEDLIGDHGLEIVANGMNAAGKLTLDVFRTTRATKGKGLEYHSICQIAADEVSVEESVRPDSYSSGQKPGASFPIVADFRDPESQNVMDLVRVSYGWNQDEGRYVPGPAQKIPGEQVQQTQLQALFQSPGEDAFEQFIAGSWVEVIPPAKGKNEETYGSIINFDPRARLIALSSGNTQELYLWRESHRTIANRLLAIGENEAVLQIQLIRTFSITVDTPLSIVVTIVGSETGETPVVRYTRINDDIRARLLTQPDAQVALSPLSLKGKYAAPDGRAIDFEGSHLTWTDRTGERTGAFAMFRLGEDTIMTVRMDTPGPSPGPAASWLLSYQEKKSAAGTSRALLLSPIQLTVKGYEDVSGDLLQLTQTEPPPKK